MKKTITFLKKTLLVGVLLPIGMLNAQDKIYLSTTGLDTNDGFTAETAVATFLKAIGLTNASAGVVKEIIIAPGRYIETGTPTLNIPAPDLIIRGESATNTILERSGTGRLLNTLSTYLSTTNNLTIRDLTFKNATLSNNQGAAINFGRTGASNNNLTLERVIFENNQVNAVDGNSSNGGALFFGGNQLTVTDCYFKGNKVNKGGAYSPNGGAIIIKTVNNTNGVFATFTNTTFEGNEANNIGGAIYVNNSDTYTTAPTESSYIKLVNCTFLENKAGAATGSALAFDIKDGASNFLFDYYIANCTFVNNSSNNASTANRNTVNFGGTRYANAYLVNNLFVPLASTTGNTITAGTNTDEKLVGQNNLIGGAINASINSSYFRDNATANNNLIGNRSDFYINETLTNNSSGSVYAVPYLALNAGSVAINAGVNSYGTPNIVPANDVRGTAVFGSAKEIGAYEYRAVPGVPTTVIATPGSNSATVEFTAPVDNGGSTIIDYTVISNPGGFTTTGSASPIIITGLSNGTEYTFTVIARNAAGSSSASVASAAVTPNEVSTSTSAVNNSISILNSNGGIRISGLEKTDLLQVYSSNGAVVFAGSQLQSETLVPVSQPGMYIVTINGKAQKHLYR